MFSSNEENAVNPLTLFLQVQSGEENFNGYNVSQTHHSDDPFITRFDFPVLNPQVITSGPLIHYTELQRNGMMNNDNHEHEILVECSRLGSVLAKKPVKKDRHSKINTAQGLRDRRVRLSIGIAREFFDLQDMLGFDKASKTLEWLLNNSRKAIKELAQTKNGDETKSYASNSNTEMTENYASNCKDKRRSKSFVNETREKARDKMCNKRQCEEAEKLSSKVYEHNVMPCFYEQTIHHEESSTSMFVKKKLNPSDLGFEQPNFRDGINSKDSTSSNNSSSNWDMNNNNNQFTDTPFRAMHDADLRGGAGYQVYGKPW